MIYNTKAIAAEFESYLVSKIAHYALLPTLYVIQIGDDFASSKYIEYKEAKCKSLGIKCIIQKFEPNIDPQIVSDYLISISKNSSGIVIQLPVDAKYDILLDILPYKNDVDLLTPHSELFNSKNLLPPTIAAIDLVLKKLQNQKYDNFSELISTKIDLTGKNVAIIGQGKLVGSPLLTYFKNRNATIISINKDSIEPEKLTKNANIIISAAGVKNLINKNWIGENTIVIDAATLESSGSQQGDVDRNNIPENTILCPSPGGIGRLTILYILYNLLAFPEIF